MLYHYTDQNGFIGIVENKEIWATKIQYLNDDNEYKLAFDLASKYLNKKLLTETDEAVIFRLTRFKDTIKGISNLNVLVCSLSENGDLLSQWRGYSRTLGGYSIGFDSEKLKEIIQGQGFVLRECVYDFAQQERLIKVVVDETLEKYRDYEETSPNTSTTSSDSSREFCSRLSLIAPIIKDHSFAEEKEWRIINPQAMKYKNLDFRAGRSMLIPFYKVSLDGAGMLIKEIIVGHTPHVELAIKATEGFLWKIFPHPVGRPVVKPSQIPYRNW